MQLTQLHRWLLEHSSHCLCAVSMAVSYWSFRQDDCLRTAYNSTKQQDIEEQHITESMCESLQAKSNHISIMIQTECTLVGLQPTILAGVPNMQKKGNLKGKQEEKDTLILYALACNVAEVDATEGKRWQQERPA